MRRGESGGLKGRAQGRAGEPVSALDPAVLTQRRAVMPISAGGVRRRCHFYFARRVSFQPCADNDTTRHDTACAAVIICCHKMTGAEDPGGEADART
jgi:hypothetical protein